MKYPMVNICSETWKEIDYMDAFVLWDAYIYTDNEEFLKICITNKIFCDCNGNIYKIFDLAHPTSIWRKVFKFLPNVYKIELRLKRTGESMSLDQLKNFMLDRLRKLPPDKFLNDWKAEIKIAKSHEELILA